MLDYIFWDKRCCFEVIYQLYTDKTINVSLLNSGYNEVEILLPQIFSSQFRIFCLKAVFHLQIIVKLSSQKYSGTMFLISELIKKNMISIFFKRLINPQILLPLKISFWKWLMIFLIISFLFPSGQWNIKFCQSHH